MDLKMRDAIMQLFNDVLRCDKPTVRDPSSNDQWESAVLGFVNDRAFPISLQFCDHIYKLPAVDCEDFKTAHDGTVTFGDILPCGHRGKGGVRSSSACLQCQKLIVHIAEEVTAGLRV
jgi:hypothetical protein